MTKRKWILIFRDWKLRMDIWRTNLEFGRTKIRTIWFVYDQNKLTFFWEFFFIGFQKSLKMLWTITVWNKIVLTDYFPVFDNLWKGLVQKYITAHIFKTTHQCKIMEWPTPHQSSLLFILTQSARFVRMFSAFIVLSGSTTTSNKRSMFSSLLTSLLCVKRKIMSSTISSVLKSTLISSFKLFA